MLAFIRGKIIRIAKNFLIIEANNLGYKVFVLPEKFKTNQEVGLYLYHQIRENNQSLYGFKNFEQKQAFELLLEVNGSGPKKAMEILAKIDHGILLLAIKNQDKKSLELNGLTATMADKVLSDLKNKIKKITVNFRGAVNRIDEEALEALKRLGYKEQETLKILGALSSNLSTGEKIREALKRLGK